MRTLLLLLPTVLLFGQATTKVAATNAKVTNFKETGSPSAPITLELFTDYQCPSCRMFYVDELPLVMSQYVNTGKVRLIHRDYPLPQHQYSRVATKYANAAQVRNGAANEIAPITADGRSWRRSTAGSISAPAKNVSMMLPKPAMKSTHAFERKPIRFPARS